MVFHQFLCECGKIIEATGPRSLCMFVRAHQGLGCQKTKTPYVEKTDNEILESDRYVKPLGASSYDPTPVVPYGSRTWTPSDYKLLEYLKISTLADLRDEVELAARYHNPKN